MPVSSYEGAGWLGVVLVAHMVNAALCDCIPRAVPNRTIFFCWDIQMWSSLGRASGCL